MAIDNAVFSEFLTSLMAPCGEGKEILVCPWFSCFFKEEMLTEENKALFVEAVSQLPSPEAKKQIADLVGKPPLYLMEWQAMIVMGAGYALGAWKLFPICKGRSYYSQAFRADRDGLLPMVSGIGQKGKGEADAKDNH